MYVFGMQCCMKLNRKKFGNLKSEWKKSSMSMVYRVYAFRNQTYMGYVIRMNGKLAWWICDHNEKEWK